MKNYKQLLGKIKTLVFDVDGVMSKNFVFLTTDKEMMRTANVKDGYAMHLAVRKGYRIVIISGGISNAVRNRFEVLGVKDIFLGVSNKIEVFKEFAAQNDIDPSTCLYMGDDIPDYEVMEAVGLPTCPADAAEEIKKISLYISDKKGGEGCVRDVIEQVMKVQGTWMTDGAFHW
jgi:3-deoxy-D-manno-octulosonate 8-phosphate phosphatase (KDO 8-P phosphatase)